MTEFFFTNSCVLYQILDLNLTQKKNLKKSLKKLYIYIKEGILKFSVFHMILSFFLDLNLKIEFYNFCLHIAYKFYVILYICGIINVINYRKEVYNVRKVSEKSRPNNER